MKIWAIVLVGLILLISCATFAEAGVGPKIVQGYVKDVDGNPLAGIPVAVMINTHSDSTTTDEDGYYMITFPYDVWSIGDKINVSVVINSQTMSKEITANDQPYQCVNFQESVAIPEFGSNNSVVLILVAIIVLLIGMWLLREKLKL
jgi:hypothetical protein